MIAKENDKLKGNPTVRADFGHGEPGDARAAVSGQARTSVVKAKRLALSTQYSVLSTYYKLTLSPSSSSTEALNSNSPLTRRFSIGRIAWQ